jgi:DNA-binding NtrC family response regulator
MQNKINTLIVDDISTNLKLLKTILNSNFKEINVIEANNAQEALDILEKEDIDLILSDIGITSMDIIKLLKKVREKNSNMEFIVISTNDDATNYFLDTIRFGVSGYILRPFEIEQLKYTILGSIEKISLRRRNLEYNVSLKSIAEEKTQQIEAQLSLNSMSKMVSVIAHQSRQSLTSINLILSKIRIMFSIKNYNSENFNIDYSSMVNQIEELDLALANLNIFFKEDIVLATISINNIIELSLTPASKLIHKNKINFSIKCDIEKKSVLYTSEHDLSQSILNIYKNIIHEFNTNNISNRIIEVKIDEDKNYVNIIIFDNASSKNNKILVSLNNLDFNSEVKSDIAIDLFISKSIIENKLYGKIEAKSLDNGKLITIKLPKDNKNRIILSSKELKVYAKDMKVLIVDNSRYLNNELFPILKYFFYKIDMVSTKEEALVKYKKEDYDLVFINYDMLIEKGLELSKNIKAMNRDQVIIIMSAYIDDFIIDFIDIGITSFLKKPILLEHLTNVLLKNCENIVYTKELKKAKQTPIIKTNNNINIELTETKENKSISGLLEHYITEEINNLNDDFEDLIHSIILNGYQEDHIRVFTDILYKYYRILESLYIQDMGIIFKDFADSISNININDINYSELLNIVEFLHKDIVTFFENIFILKNTKNVNYLTKSLESSICQIQKELMIPESKTHCKKIEDDKEDELELF